MAFDYLLPIDSKNTNYQFIHLDLDRSYGIACKFDFTANDSTFKITHTKVVLTDPNDETKPAYYAYKNLSGTEIVNENDYKWQIKVDLEEDKNRSAETQLEVGEIRKSVFDLKPKDECINTKHIIDVCIENLETTTIPIPNKLKLDDEGIVVKFGSHFCKFYIV